MDGTEDDAGYLPNPNGANHQQDYGSSRRAEKLPVRSPQYITPVNDRDLDEDESEDDEEEEENNNRSNGVRYVGKDLDEDDDDDVEDNDEENGEEQKYSGGTKDVDLDRHPKKQKLKSLISSYEFAPRVPAAPSVPALPVPTKQSSGGRNSLTDWTERETFALLDSWGDKFLQRGRKSLRSEEWQKVTERVSEVSRIERTDTQCRNRLDTLKKKYKKEKGTLSETRKWVYFKKMDMLLSPQSQQPQQNGISCSQQPQQNGISCRLNSGEYVFMTPKVSLSHANRFNEMKDSPVDSESTDREDDDSDGLPPKKRKVGRQRQRHKGSPLTILADSIHKFSDIYEKIEDGRRQQMVEIENMRMNFYKELEMQKRKIMERAQAEIVKIRQEGSDDEENDGSAENASG